MNACKHMKRRSGLEGKVMSMYGLLSLYDVLHQLSIRKTFRLNQMHIRMEYSSDSPLYRLVAMEFLNIIKLSCVFSFDYLDYHRLLSEKES